MKIENNKLVEAYEYLRDTGRIHTQKDVADRMNASTATISKALSGDPVALTSRFLRRLNHAFGDIFNEDWLLNGEGAMLRPQPNISLEQKNLKIHGDNTNNIGFMGDMSSSSGEGLASPEEVKKLRDELASYKKMYEKAQVHIDKLLAIIEILSSTKQDKS